MIDRMNLNLQLITNKMNQRILITPIIFILVVGILPFVSADIFATIGTQGLSFVDPEVAGVVNGIICVQDPILCIENKIKGIITGLIYQAVAEASPEAARVLALNNQIEGYVDEGAEIIRDLQVDEQGQIQEGTIQFSEEIQEIGNLIGEDLENDKVFISQAEFEKSEGITTITFNTNESLLVNKDQFGRNHFFTNIRKANSYCFVCQSESESGTNNAYVKFDDQGDIVETDFMTNERGGVYVIGNDRINVPPNSRVLFKDGKVTIDIPDQDEGKSTSLELPNFIDPKLSGNLIEIRGKNIELIGTQTQAILNSGIVHIKDGQIYIPEITTSIINDVEIDTGNVDVELFFDGLEHPESEAYVSMNIDDKKLIANMEPLIYRKYEEYPFKSFTVAMLKDNFLVTLEENDNLLFDLVGGSFISIQNRIDQGLIPEVIVQTNQRKEINGESILDGLIFLENGRKAYTFDGDELQLQTRGTDVVGSIPFDGDELQLQTGGTNVGGSIPIEIKFQDRDGNTLLGTREEPKKIIVNNYNDFAIVPLDFFGEKEVIEGFSRVTITTEAGPCGYGIIGCTEEFRLQSFDSALNSLRRRGVQIYGGGEGRFEGKDPREFLTNEQIRDIDNLIAAIPEDVLETQIIEIYPDGYWDYILGMEGTYGLAMEGGRFLIPERSIRSDMEVFYHENIHIFHYSSLDSDWERAWLNLDGSYGKDKDTSPLFTDTAGQLFLTWEDGSRGPRYGKVEAYGENNKFEDVATIPTYIIQSLNGERKRAPYWELIDPTSNFYRKRIGIEYETGVMDSRLAREWADIYLGKLFLAYNSGMIRYSQHKQIIEMLPEGREREIKIREFEISRRIRR